MHPLFPIATAATLSSVVVVVIYTLWLGSRGDSSAPKLSRDEIRRHILWGLFYMNPNDGRGWVPKMSGLGMTMNFRERKHVFVFIALLVFTLSSALAMTWAAMS